MIQNPLKFLDLKIGIDDVYRLGDHYVCTNWMEKHGLHCGRMIHDLLLWILDHGLDDESACLVCPSSTVNLDAIQQICDLITENGGSYGINAHDARNMVKEMNLVGWTMFALFLRGFFTTPISVILI